MRFSILIIILFLAVGTSAQKPAFKIKVTALTGGFYVCTSYGIADGVTYPANSLFAVTKAGVILIDTPWGDEQTQQLMALIKRRFNQKIVLCISTHFHDDKLGGVNALRKTGTKTYTSNQTYALAKQNGKPLPQYTFAGDTTFKVGGLTLQTFYPGEGHTKDNQVVWFPQARVMVGGCFVKSLESDGIGNIADANLKQWPQSIRNLQNRFKDAAYIIPGHLGWQGGGKMLTHTLNIIAKQQ